jgi:hypothetical protein
MIVVLINLLEANNVNTAACMLFAEYYACSKSLPLCAAILHSLLCSFISSPIAAAV